MGVGAKAGALCALATLLVAAAGVRATPVVNVGTHNLLANTTGQTITLAISDSTPGISRIAGLDFVIQIGNGTGTAPQITDVDIIHGTIFDGNNTGQTTFVGGDFPQAKARSTTTLTGFIANDNGTLAKIMVDTTNVNSGTFTFSIGAGSTRLGPTTFTNDQGFNVPATLTDGSITIPEPAAAGLLGLAAGGAVLRHRRRAGAPAAASHPID